MYNIVMLDMTVWFPVESYKLFHGASVIDYGSYVGIVVITTKQKWLRWHNIRRLQGHPTKIKKKNETTNVRHKLDKHKTWLDMAELLSYSSKRKVQSLRRRLNLVVA